MSRCRKSLGLQDNICLDKNNQALLVNCLLLEECELENAKEELEYIYTLSCVIKLFKETEKYMWLIKMIEIIRREFREK